jgi:hypothetical protein
VEKQVETFVLCEATGGLQRNLGISKKKETEITVGLETGRLYTTQHISYIPIKLGFQKSKIINC